MLNDTFSLCFVICNVRTVAEILSRHWYITPIRGPILDKNFSFWYFHSCMYGGLPYLEARRLYYYICKCKLVKSMLWYCVCYMKTLTNDSSDESHFQALRRASKRTCGDYTCNWLVSYLGNNRSRPATHQTIIHLIILQKKGWMNLNESKENSFLFVMTI